MEERIGHYTIISELGRGGMGVVYKAHEESLNRLVALKVLGKHLSEDDSFVARFKREAQSAAALNHPNIVQVHAISEFDGQHCFAMEFVNGSSISELIKQSGPMDPVKASRLILQAASGLGAAHNKGIYHRDIKPANLMVDESGLLKIADFGLALLAEANTQLTATGMFMGTPGYLSPEQCLGEGVDQRTDIYSLGVTLYEMLTGVTPLKADSPLALLRQIIDVEPRDVGELRPEVPESLRSILRKMMAKKPEDRYQDCSELISDLQIWLVSAGGQSSGAYSGQEAGWSGSDDQATVVAAPSRLRTDTVKVPVSSSRRRNSVAALVIVVAMAVLAGGSYAAWKYVADKQDRSVASSSISTAAGTFEPSLEPNEAQFNLNENDSELDVADFNQTDVIETDIVAPEDQGYASSNYPESFPDQNDNQLDLQNPADEQTFDSLQDSAEPVVGGITAGDNRPLPAENSQLTQSDGSSVSVSSIDSSGAGGQIASQGSEIASTGSRAHAAPAVAKVGSGVALVSVGEVLLADSAADYVRQALSRHGVVVIDGMTVPGVAERLSAGGGEIQSLLRPRARYLIYISADFVNERQLYFMGRSDTELQSRLNMETHDLSDGSVMGESIHSSIGYTALSVNDKVQELLRPKFSGLAGRLAE